jgi:glycosyltransferase involved in cell wall biosynthesis
LRILIVSAFYERHGGGIEVVAGEMARALGRRGHDCRWAAAAFDEAPHDPLIGTVPLPASDPIEHWTGLPMPIPNARARRQLEREVAAADAVIVHDALYVSSILAARYASRHGKPWLLVQHIGAIPYTSALLRAAIGAANRLVTRRMLSRASQAVFISDAVRGLFRTARLKNPPALLFNGVDRDLFRPADKRVKARLRKSFGTSDERRQLLFVGRFVEKKGLPALRELAAANPQWDLSVVGSGPLDPAKWGLRNVRLLGRKSRRELADLYRAADALVLPSVGEGFPLVVQEAMASGLPVFCGMDSATADPGAAHLLHGVCVDPANPALTASRIASAIAAAAPAPDLRLSAYARSTYDWDSNAAWIERRIHELRGEEAAAAPIKAEPKAA